MRIQLLAVGGNLPGGSWQGLAVGIEHVELSHAGPRMAMDFRQGLQPQVAHGDQGGVDGLGSCHRPDKLSADRLAGLAGAHLHHVGASNARRAADHARPRIEAQSDRQADDREWQGLRRRQRERGCRAHRGKLIVNGRDLRRTVLADVQGFSDGRHACLVQCEQHVVAWQGPSRIAGHAHLVTVSRACAETER